MLSVVTNIHICYSTTPKIQNEFTFLDVFHGKRKRPILNMAFLHFRISATKEITSREVLSQVDTYETSKSCSQVWTFVYLLYNQLSALFDDTKHVHHML